MKAEEYEFGALVYTVDPWPSAGALIDPRSKEPCQIDDFQVEPVVLIGKGAGLMIVQFEGRPGQTHLQPERIARSEAKILAVASADAVQVAKHADAVADRLTTLANRAREAEKETGPEI